MNIQSKITIFLHKFGNKEILAIGWILAALAMLFTSDLLKSNRQSLEKDNYWNSIEGKNTLVIFLLIFILGNIPKEVATCPIELFL